MDEVVLSIIVPTYKERDNIGILITRIDLTLRSVRIPYEIIIVDDNSPDGTADYAETLSKAYPVRIVRRSGKLGLSSAVLDGVRVSRGSVIAVMDADLQHPPEVLTEMLGKLINNACDVVIASRYVEGGSVSGWSFFRRLVSLGAILMARVLLPKVRGVKDPMSGYFMFRREVIDGVIDEMNPGGFKVLLEILVKGRVRKVSEVPYIFGRRYQGESKLGPREIVNYLMHVLDLAPECIRFAIIGATGTVINLGALVLLRYLLEAPHVMASAIAIEASMVNNFILNDIWTFRKRYGVWWRKFLNFHASSATAILVQWIVSNIVYYVVLSSSILAQLLGILAGFVLNYIISKKFVWTYSL